MYLIDINIIFLNQPISHKNDKARNKFCVV